MTGAATGGAVAAVRLRRLAVLLALLTAVFTVRAPVCADAMAATMPAPLTSMAMTAPDLAVGSLVLAGAATPSCPEPLAGASTVGLASCMQAPTALSATVAAAIPFVGALAVVVAPTVPALATVVVGPPCTATLHQLCLSRT